MAWVDRLGSWKTLKSGVLLFWAAWFTLAAAADVFDALKTGGIVPRSWTFASGNWELMLKVTGTHATPVAVVALLFLGAIAWEVLAALLFWRAWAARGRGGIAAFTVALAFFAALALADEIFIFHTLGPTHLRLFGVQLLSVLALRLLPD